MARKTRRRNNEELLEEVRDVLHDNDLKIAARVRRAQDLLDHVFDGPLGADVDEDEDEDEDEDDEED